MPEIVKAIALDTWAGKRFYAVEVIGRTSKRIRVSLTHRLSPDVLHMPHGIVRYRGDAFLVPEYAIREIDEGRLERDFYAGRVYEYGKA